MPIIHIYYILHSSTWREIELLRLAPLLMERVVKGIGCVLSATMDKRDRMDGWQSSVNDEDMAEGNSDKRAVEMTWSGQRS